LTRLTTRTIVTRAMPLKRQPSDDELNALADEFRPLWRPGDVVRPWLRKHQTRLRALVADEWSWAALADALTRAGVTFRTKRPWTGDALKHEVRRAGLPLKRSRPEVMSQLHVIPPAVQPTAPQPERPTQPQFRPAVPQTRGTHASPAVAAPPVPRFKAFSLKPQEPPRPLTPEEMEEREAMHHRMFGK
jgi:hypothetical protein